MGGDYSTILKCINFIETAKSCLGCLRQCIQTTAAHWAEILNSISQLYVEGHLAKLFIFFNGNLYVFNNYSSVFCTVGWSERVPKSAKEVHLRKKLRTERICYLERVHSRRFFHSPMHLTRKYLNKNRHFIDHLINNNLGQKVSICLFNFLTYSFHDLLRNIFWPFLIHSVSNSE